jgi:iron complex transport system substrate-binding protein
VFRILSVCIAVALSTGCRKSPKEVTAQDGQSVARIVSTAPNLTEITFALGAGEKLVGVTRYCDYPAAAQKITRVGGYLDPSVEKIVALKPDLVLLTVRASSQTLAQALARFQIPVSSLPLDTLLDVRHSFSVLGKAIGKVEEAARLTAAFDAAIKDQIARIPKGVAPPRIVVIIGHRPLIVAGKGSFIDDLLKLAGGYNLAQSSNQPYPQWSAETLLREKPEVIIDAWMGGSNKTASNVPDRWRSMTGIPAVKNGRVHRVADDRLLRPGPRLTEALASIITLLYPGAKP